MSGVPFTVYTAMGNELGIDLYVVYVMYFGCELRPS